MSIARDIPSELLSGNVGVHGEAADKEKEVDVLMSDEGVQKIARWLSDWHLLRFLTDCGMFEEVRVLAAIYAKRTCLPELRCV